MRTLLSFAFSLALPFAIAANAADRPNVLLIAIDDLRPELGCYGAEHIKSPNIDTLAESGVLFERAYCQQAVCNPSRTSLMTGLRPDTIGVTTNHVHFRSIHPNVVTLPELFKNSGYHTQSIGKIYHGPFPEGTSKTVWDTMGDPQSWSVPTTRFGPRYYYTEDGIRQAKQSYCEMYNPRNPGPEDWAEKLVFGPMTESPDVPDNTLYDGMVADAAVETLGRLKDSREPFFLAVGFIKPHTPFVAPKKYYDLYEDAEIDLAATPDYPRDAPELAGHNSEEVRRYTDQPKRGKFTEENQRRLRHGYFACISFMDAQVGRVLDALKRNGLADNTIVVLYGDHGWHLGEHGLWGKTTNFELDTRAPLIVRAPGQQATRAKSSALVEFVDIYPTVAELAGLPQPVDLEGSSCVLILEYPTRSWKTAAFSQFPRGDAMGYSMRTNRWRYTEWIRVKSRKLVARELYDHQNDPAETVNLATDHEKETLMSELSAQLEGGRGWRAVAADLPVTKAPTETTVFEKGDDSGSKFGYRIPALTVSKVGTVVAFCERRVGLNDHAKNDIVLRRSEDGGVSWGDLIVIADDGNDSLNDPLVVALDSGRLLLRYKRYPEGVHSRNSNHTVIAEAGFDGPKNTRVYLTHSDDDGQTWSKPREVTREMRRPEAIAVGSPGVAIQLLGGPHKGRIVLPNYEVYSLGGGNRKSANSVSYSDDEGETWKLSEPISEGNLPGFGNEAQLVELADGGILMSARSHEQGGFRRISISRDGGDTWSPHRFNETLRTPACMSSLIRYSWPNGNEPGLILHSLPATKNQRANGTLFYSRDEGETWVPGAVIQPGSFAYSCLTKLPTGDIGCLYESDGYKKIVFRRISLRDALNGNKQSIKIACIGDSITYGSGISDRKRQSYPARLQELLGKRYEVGNFGRPGADVLEINNGPFAKTEQHRDAMAFEPDVVVCNLGINDVTLLADNEEAFVKDYTRLLQQYAALPSKPNLYLWTELAPIMPGHRNHDKYHGLKATYHSLLRKVAAKVGAEEIDAFTPLVDHPEWFPDHLHPNPVGAAVIAYAVAEVVVPHQALLALDRLHESNGEPTTGVIDFEDARPGPVKKLTTPVGVWSAEPGNVAVDDAHARTGEQCLRLVGGRDREVVFEANAGKTKANRLTLWAERWTKRSPFEFRIDQLVNDKWLEIYNGDESIRVGGFHTLVDIPIRVDSPYRFRLRSTSPTDSGILIDDVALVNAEPMKVVAATMEQTVLPALVGVAASPVGLMRIDVKGNSEVAPVVTSIELAMDKDTDLADVEQVAVYYTSNQRLVSARGNPNAFADARQFGQSATPAEVIQFRGRQSLIPGANYFWVAFKLNSSANIDHRLRAVATKVMLQDGTPLSVNGAADKEGQRMGVAVRRQGDDSVHTFRIPGLATTNAGTLIAVYDIRRRSGGDLPGDIDVGMSRSTDGGRSWEPMQVIMDMGHDPKWSYDGIGDPTVMVDRETGTLWVAATWSHGKRSWVGSGPGLEPAETGQFILVRSDDDGRSWSKPINITKQVKKPEWCFLLQGPGKGITMLDGTLVIPAQYQDTPENKRLPRSTFIYSRDRGQTWQIATGAFDDTTEAQVVELDPDTLMINCRYNREPHRVVMTTNDMGQTWQIHSSSRKALIEPGSCMASLIDVDREIGREAGGWLLFSNPDSGRARERITIKASNDGGATWPKENQILLDEAPGAGYSCMTMIDDKTVGILYEGSQAHMTFQRVPLAEVIGSE